MSATLGAALKKIAVALLADRKNWRSSPWRYSRCFSFLLPVPVEAIFQRT